VCQIVHSGREKLMGYLSIQLLGSFRVTLDGTPVTAFESDKVRTLLAYLAVEGDRPHRREKLVGLLWPEWPEANARANLSQALYNLRVAIGDRTAEPSFLLISPRTIQFNRASDHSLDVTLLTELPEAPSLAQLKEVAAAYEGPFLGDFSLPDSAPFEEWALAIRERLHRLALDAMLRLARLYEGQNDLEPALDPLHRGVELDLCWEEGHYQIMRLLALIGRRSGALEQYERCRSSLWRELGVEPAATTVELFERIRREELGPEPAVEIELPGWLVQAEDAPRPLFVGRERQLAKLERFLEAAVAGQGQVAFITGGPGRGKTALMDEFAHRAMEAHPDLLVAAGHCNAFAGAGDPYLPFRQVMGMLTGEVETRWAAGAISREHASRLWKAIPAVAAALVDQGRDLIDILVPETALLKRVKAAVPGADLWGRLNAFIEQQQAAPDQLETRQLLQQVVQVLQVLAAERPVLLLLDDLQWVDSASVALLFHLGRELAGVRVLIVGAYRPEEVALPRDGERHPLEKVLSEFKRQYGQVWLDLAQAEQVESRAFVDAFLDSEPNRLGEAFRAGLVRHAGGHPLFTVELLRSLQERGDLVLDGEGRWVEGPSLDWEALPARVEGVIQERIGRLEQELRDILTIASVEGEAFTAQVVARVGEIEERKVLRQLSRELAKQHRLVRERGEECVGRQTLSHYRFAHALFHRYLYNELSAGERRLLHREVGGMLELLYGEDAERMAPQLARHFDEAGMPEKAIRYLLASGDRARLAYAHQEAIAAYKRALVLLTREADYHRAARTAMKLGLTYHIAFDFKRARRVYDEGFALWQRAGRTSPVTPATPTPHPLRLQRVEPLTLDPTTAWTGYSLLVIDHLFSGLVRLTPEMDVIPASAQSWRVTEGGRRYIFYLRDDARWSDGARVTAGDFEFSWKRLLDPAIGTPSASLLFDIAGAEVFHRGTGKRDDVGVRALDETTLTLELEKPTSHFLTVLAGAYPVPRHVVEAHGESWTAVGNLVCNGPFKLVAWRRGASMVLERNPEYRGRSTGNVGRVELHFFADKSARLEMYEADELDVLQLEYSLPAYLDAARRRHAAEYVTLPMLSTMSVNFVHTRPPFDDPRVRRAFVHATDRETLAEVIWRGTCFPATGGFVPPGLPGHSPGIALPFDPRRARELLADAGYPGGRGFPVVQALSYTDPLSSLLSEYWQGQWQQNLGIESEWEAVNWGEARGRVAADQSIHLDWGGSGAECPDPAAFLRVDVIGGHTQWRNDIFEQLVQEARGLTDQGERIALFQEADRILVQEAPLMPCAYGRTHLLVKPWVSRYSVSAMGQHFWQDVIIEPH
jgi:ABC-type oligopeptide transport system substrate-binding subunit/DNA-binding SARP family transcriptional activator